MSECNNCYGDYYTFCSSANDTDHFCSLDCEESYFLGEYSWEDVKGWIGVAIFALVLLAAGLSVVHYTSEWDKCHRHGGAYIREYFGYKCIMEKK